MVASSERMFLTDILIFSDPDDSVRRMMRALAIMFCLVKKNKKKFCGLLYKIVSSKCTNLIIYTDAITVRAVNDCSFSSSCWDQNTWLF